MMIIAYFHAWEKPSIKTFFDPIGWYADVKLGWVMVTVYDKTFKKHILKRLSGP